LFSYIICDEVLSTGFHASIRHQVTTDGLNPEKSFYSTHSTTKGGAAI
jgi:hypothetical protein